jgi:hypothetical protein
MRNNKNQLWMSMGAREPFTYVVASQGCNAGVSDAAILRLYYSLSFSKWPILLGGKPVRLY